MTSLVKIGHGIVEVDPQCQSLLITYRRTKAARLRQNLPFYRQDLQSVKHLLTLHVAT